MEWKLFGPKQHISPCVIKTINYNRMEVILCTSAVNPIGHSDFWCEVKYEETHLQKSSLSLGEGTWATCGLWGSPLWVPKKWVLERWAELPVDPEEEVLFGLSPSLWVLTEFSTLATCRLQPSPLCFYREGASLTPVQGVWSRRDGPSQSALWINSPRITSTKCHKYFDIRF